METKEEALRKKEIEVQEELSNWLKSCGHFNIGDQVHVSFTLTECSPVVVEAGVHGKRIKRWQNVSSQLSNEDWQTILSVQTKSHYQKLLEFIQESGNKPFDLKDIKRQFGWSSGWDIYNDSINTACFTRYKLPYRIREVQVGSSNDQTLYQIFKVRPLYRKK